MKLIKEADMLEFERQLKKKERATEADDKRTATGSYGEPANLRNVLIESGRKLKARHVGGLLICPCHSLRSCETSGKGATSR